MPDNKKKRDMDKRQFKQLLNYLRCHPSDAALLGALLSGVEDTPKLVGKEQGVTKNLNTQPIVCLRKNIEQSFTVAEWVSARRAGTAIGKSSTWIRRKMKEGLFASTRQDQNGNYMFYLPEVLADYDAYIRRKTLSVTNKKAS